VSELLDNYREWLVASGASADTVKARVQAARRLLAAGATEDPCKLTPQHVVRVLARVQARWSKATYYNHAVNFAAYCAFAGLRTDFLVGIVKPRVPKGQPRPIDVAEFRRALVLAPPDALMMFLLAAYVGLRVHEIAKVRGEDVRDGSLFTVGKGEKDAYVPLHPVLARHAEGFPTEGWWFPNVAGTGPIGRATVWRHMHRVLKEVGSKATPHQVRHLYGTSLVLSGADLRTTQELLRHSSLSSTQIYTLVGDDRKTAAIAMLPDYTAEIA
jgi:integrase/recombinase XerD